ncbi:MAG: hypothetical protein K2K41_07250, partial [Ruminiclostridium sp.]|nr:hypothetical protein [Ruminiclostridium sp.]
QNCSWIDEEGYQHYESDWETAYCKVKSYKTFIVTDGEKLRALAAYAQIRPDNRYLGNISLLSSHSTWNYGNNIRFEEEIPSDFIAITVEFYNANVRFNDTITEKALEELTSRPSLSGTYRESTRYGFGRGEGYISGFADVTVNK